MTSQTPDEIPARLADLDKQFAEQGLPIWLRVPFAFRIFGRTKR
jgi:hypothetical protein